MGLIHDLGARALMALPPETAHGLSLTALAMGLGPSGRTPAGLETRFAGLTAPNPIGLAAGYDKDARAPDALLRMGFGFVEVGTITPLPQAGNPKPRLFRLRADGAVINRMGFNNGGLAAAVSRLQARAGRGGIVGVNVGANKDSADRVADYETGLDAVWTLADYVTANISSPNTPGLRGLQEGDALEELLGRLTARRDALTVSHGPKPLFVKIAPDLDDAAVHQVVAKARAARVDGLIVSNTTLARPDTLTSPHRGEAGGLSGAPLMGPSTRVLAQAALAAEGALTLIGAGGVASGADALAKLKAGAHAVQLYSALALRGPGLISEILGDLAARLRADGFRSVSEAVGAGLR